MAMNIEVVLQRPVVGADDADSVDIEVTKSLAA